MQCQFIVIQIAINDPTGEKNVVRFENYVSDLAATRETPWAAVADASVQWARCVHLLRLHFQFNLILQTLFADIICGYYNMRCILENPSHIVYKSQSCMRILPLYQDFARESQHVS